jgi:hypothetical protein
MLGTNQDHRFPHHLDIVKLCSTTTHIKIPCNRETYILLGNSSQNLLIIKEEYLKIEYMETA